MEENLCRYKKREEAKQEHRNTLLQHWGNPAKMEEILDQSTITNLSGDLAREHAIVLADKLKKTQEFAKLEANLKDY